MVAPVGGSDYGPLALATQLYGDASIVHKAPRTCFRPQPKVDSCIVMLRARQAPRYPDLDDALVRRVVRTAFGQRRKTLRNSLTKGDALGLPKQAVLEALEAAGIEGGRRPQTLSLEEFAALARAVKAHS
jgi:16S rRNA (adenine1518-N6/adenine1519-N6)-dimethyltransferase